LLLAALSPGMVHATPFTWGNDPQGDPIKPLRWPSGSTINIYIEADPDEDPPDRSALLEEGMERWAAQMDGRGITIVVETGAVPDPPPANLIRCTYEPVGTELVGQALGDDADAIASCGGDPDNGLLNRGQIIIRDDIAAGTAAERETLRNLAQHEVTHVLGLGDDVDGEVTRHDQDNTPNNYNTTDQREISSLYPALGGDPSNGRGGTFKIPPDEFQYIFDYEGTPDDHVALIVMDIDPSLIAGISPPSGWVCLNPADPQHRSLDYPFYVDYYEDGGPEAPPWDPAYTAPLACRALDGASALSATNPSVELTVFTVGAVSGNIRVWAGGDVQILEGPVISPIPSLSFQGLICLFAALYVAGIVMMRGRAV
jgi:hypothetical protein